MFLHVLLDFYMFHINLHVFYMFILFLQDSTSQYYIFSVRSHGYIPRSCRVMLNHASLDVYQTIMSYRLHHHYVITYELTGCMIL